MTSSSDLDLSLRYLGLRFVSGETEAFYRDWRVDDAIPFIRFGMIAAVFSWLATIFGFIYASPEQLALLIQPLSFATIPSIILAFALTLLRNAHRLVFPATALANTCSGLAIVWFLHQVQPFIDASAVDSYMINACLIVMFFAYTIFRLPLIPACVAMLPYLALTVLYIFQDFSRQTITATEAGILLVPLFIGMQSGILICCILSIITRRNFVHQQTIHQQQSLIRRYVPPTVSEQITTGRAASIDKPRRCQVTVLFVDIADSTTMADRVSPDIITRLINDYMATLTNITSAHGGTVTEFAGDGVMAMFGAPTPLSGEEQGVQAIRSAQAMLAALPELNHRWQGWGLNETVKLRVGINTGTASVGSYGARGHMVYTAIGLEVNIAARLESKCSPNSILISDATYQLVAEAIDCEPKGEVVCKGVHFPVKVYAPV